MDLAEQGKLAPEVLPLEVGDKADEPNDIQHEADEAVVHRKGDKVGVDKHNVLEVVDDRFAVEEIVGDDEKVPVEGFAPWVFRVGDFLGSF